MVVGWKSADCIVIVTVDGELSGRSSGDVIQ